MNIDNPWFEGRLRSLCNVYGYVINFRHSAIEPYRTEICIRKDTDLEYAHMASMSIDPKDIPDGCGKDLYYFADAVFKRLVNELDKEIERDSKTPSQAVYCRCSSEANLTPKEYKGYFITADSMRKAIEEAIKEKGNYSAEYALFKELFIDPCIEYLSHLNDKPEGTDA